MKLIIWHRETPRDLFLLRQIHEGATCPRSSKKKVFYFSFCQARLHENVEHPVRQSTKGEHIRRFLRAPMLKWEPLWAHASVKWNYFLNMLEPMLVWSKRDPVQDASEHLRSSENIFWEHILTHYSSNIEKSLCLCPIVIHCFLWSNTTEVLDTLGALIVKWEQPLGAPLIALEKPQCLFFR